MARPLRFVSVPLCLCVSMAVATPVQASPHARVPLAELVAPAETLSVPVAGQTPPPEDAKVPSRNLQAPREITPAPGGNGAGLPFAPLGWRWMQPRAVVQTEPIATDMTDPRTSPTPPFLVVRTESGRALVLAVTPPGEPLPLPRRRRLSPVLPLALGVFTFAVGYGATALVATEQLENCSEGGDEACRRDVRTRMIPVAGPLLVARSSREPREYALATVQGAGLLLAVIGVIALLVDRQRRNVLSAHGMRIARNTAIRPDAGPGGAQLMVDARF